MSDLNMYGRIERDYRKEAAAKYADHLYEKLLDKVVWHIRRLAGSGSFGGNFASKTVWDEFCYDCQFGPHILLTDLYTMVIEPIIDDVVKNLPKTEMEFLWIWSEAFWSWDEEDEDEPEPLVYDGDVVNELWSRLRKRADGRDISRMMPNECL